MTERPSPSPEPSRRQPDVFARLEQAVGAIQDSETFRSYLDVQSRFHRYSPGNVALILSQRPDATRVAGYNAWLKLHRFVRRGERAIKIIVPMSKKVESDDGEEERKLIFGTGNVFDVSQTEGEPLPEIPVPVLEGHQGLPLLVGLYELAEHEGLQVENAPGGRFPDQRMGDYDAEKRSIRVREAATAQMTKTLAHELAHHYASHSRSDDESETTAEAVAYVVCAHFGLDTGQRSFPYIATWAKDKRVLQGALSTIQRVSATMIDKLTSSQSTPEELPPIAGGAPMKVYKGYSEDSGSAMGPVAVVVETEDGKIAPLTHQVRHSPDGFSWGYSGSGPADLARSLLADYLGFVPSPVIYQEFKRQYVARFAQGQSWQLGSEEIEQFLAQPEVRAALQAQHEDERLQAELAELEQREDEHLPN